jgi:hypothetical protein
MMNKCLIIQNINKEKFLKKKNQMEMLELKSIVDPPYLRFHFSVVSVTLSQLHSV